MFTLGNKFIRLGLGYTLDNEQSSLWRVRYSLNSVISGLYNGFDIPRTNSISLYMLICQLSFLSY